MFKETEELTAKMLILGGGSGHVCIKKFTSKRFL